MTVSNQVSHETSQGDGVNTLFPYNFLIPTADDAQVIVYDSVALTSTVIASSLYSITGIGDPNGGNVTYPLTGTPLPTTQFITIKRVIPLTQGLALTNQSDFLPDVLESQLDDIVFMVQQVSEVINRAVVIPDGAAIDPSTYLSNLSATAQAASQAIASASAASTSETNAAASAASASGSAITATNEANAATTAYNNSVALLNTLVLQATEALMLTTSVAGGFTFVNTQNGQTFLFDATVDGDVVLPRDSAVGTFFSLVQLGAGKAHFTRDDGGNLANIDTYTRTAGQWATVNLMVVQNPGGTAAEWVLSGATSP